MRVRAATLADVPELARVHTESSDAVYAGIVAPEPDGLARRTRTWRDVVEQPEFDAYLVEDDGVVVGVLNVGAAELDPSIGELYVIYVHPDHWGSGAGQLLLDKAHEVMAERFDEAVLTVLIANPRARRFYERNGWQVDDVRTELHFGGVPVEVAKYRKRLTVPDTGV